MQRPHNPSKWHGRGAERKGDNGRAEDLSSKVAGKSGRALRPDFVFGYYSGPTNRLEEHYVQHQDRFYRDLVAGIENPLRPLFYARAVHSNFVLLAFFLESDPIIADFLREHLAIESLDSVLFEMQKPEWNSKTGDKRFWYARGTVQVLLDRLYDVALAPMRLQPRIKTGIRKSSRNEHLYLFLSGMHEVKSISGLYGSNQEFFKALESTSSDLIYDVRVRVRLRRPRGALTFRELSEGEQQLLLVLGLMRFTREAESLFLLDEPDTHLNPAWSAQYRVFLQRIGGLGISSHVLMATHDPLVISALKRDEVRILERTDEGSIKALTPIEDPQGMGVGSLLTSDVYGLRSQFDIETFERIERSAISPLRTLSARRKAHNWLAWLKSSATCRICWRIQIPIFRNTCKLVTGLWKPCLGPSAPKIRCEKIVTSRTDWCGESWKPALTEGTPLRSEVYRSNAHRG